MSRPLGKLATFYYWGTLDWENHSFWSLQYRFCLIAYTSAPQPPQPVGLQLLSIEITTSRLFKQELLSLQIMECVLLTSSTRHLTRLPSSRLWNSKQFLSPRREWFASWSAESVFWLQPTQSTDATIVQNHSKTTPKYRMPFFRDSIWSFSWSTSQILRGIANSLSTSWRSTTTSEREEYRTMEQSTKNLV